MIKRDDVLGAYSALLDQVPESEKVIQKLCACDNIELLLKSIMKKDSYKRLEHTQSIWAKANLHPILSNENIIIVEGLSSNDKYVKNITFDFMKEFSSIVNRYVPQNAICFDIGANIGITTLIFSTNCRNGHVYSFEPGKNIYEILCRNITRNLCINVTTQNKAISDEVKTVEFNENSAFGSIVTNRQKSFGINANSQISADTIDNFINTNGIDRLDFIKIDTEGFEPNVLAGAKESLQRFNPIVYMEFNTLGLLLYSNSNPLYFLDDIFNKFEFVYLVHKTENAHALERLYKNNCIEIYRRVVKETTGWTVDFLCYNNELN